MLENNQNQNHNRYAVQTIDKAFNILDLFFSHEELGAADVALMLNLNRSTAFRLLTSLEKGGILQRTQKAKYRLGSKLYSLGQLAYRRLDLTSIVRPYLQRIMEETGETAFLAISDGTTGIIYLDRVVSTACLRIDITMGYRMNAHQTSVGKAILAHQSDSFLEEYLKNMDCTPATDNTIITPQQLYKEIAMIRRCGYACDNEESEKGLICYGSAILDTSGVSIAGISVSGPVTRMLSEKEKKIKAVTEATAAISKHMFSK